MWIALKDTLIAKFMKDIMVIYICLQTCYMYDMAQYLEKKINIISIIHAIIITGRCGF